MIVDQGGIGLLSSAAANAKDPQTLRMVAGTIANLCGNGIFYLSISFPIHNAYHWLINS